MEESDYLCNEEVLTPKVKMFKVKDDPCYGIHCKNLEECDTCWLKTPCSVVLRNKIANQNKQ